MHKKISSGDIKRCLWVLLILALAFSGFFIVFRLSGYENYLCCQPLTRLDTGWYRLDSGRQLPVQPGEEIPFGQDGTVTVYLRNPGFGTLTTRSALYRVQIRMDGELIYRFDDSAFPCNDQMRSKIHCDAPLRAPGEDSVLSITYFQNGKPSLKMPPVYFGTSGDVLLDHIRSDGFTLVLLSVLMLCAAAGLMLSFYFAANRILDRRLLDIIVFLLLCSVWFFCDSGLARYLSQMSPAVEGLSFYAFMTLELPFLCFIYHTGSIKERAGIPLVCAAVVLNVLIQTLLWSVGAAEFIEMLPITHVLLVTGIIVTVVEIHREYRRSKDRQLVIILLAFLLMGSSGLLALLFYWLLKISFYAVFFELGLLSFILLLCAYLCVNLMDSLRFKAESKIYERLSREDSMTGLQNRRSFDEYIGKLVESRQQNRNPVLIFLDVNGLKSVNDRFGHKAGDELIIGAAHCLKNTFDTDASCFRLGGDEFCVLIPDARRAGNWQKKLESVVAQYNRDHRIPVSLAAGSSQLLDETGASKSLSDWKQQADLQMYENKKKMKQAKL